MGDPKAKAQALRDECERLAREAERRMLTPGISDAEKIEAMDAAKVYWQMSRTHADTVAHAEMARPARFTGRNRGRNPKTIERETFLNQCADGAGTRKREAVAAYAIERQPGKLAQLWELNHRSVGFKDKAQSKVLNWMKNNGFS